MYDVAQRESVFEEPRSFVGMRPPLSVHSTLHLSSNAVMHKPRIDWYPYIASPITTSQYVLLIALLSGTAMGRDVSFD